MRFKKKIEKEKAGLKLNTQKTKIMASGLITSWVIEGEAMETVSDFIFLGSKITCDCSHEIKRCLLFGRKAMTNLDNILKYRDTGKGNGNPLQYSCLEKSTDRGAWQTEVHGVP